MIERDAQKVSSRCKELRTYWRPRNDKMRKWYRLIQMIDELRTEKMESFVGNDPRSMYNLILHLLDAEVPHRLSSYELGSPELAGVNESVSTFLNTVWSDNQIRFRRTGPRQSLSRALIGTLLATGWYAVFAINSDDGSYSLIDVWSPAETYPMWDNFDLGLSEVAHIYSMSADAATQMIKRNGWTTVDLRGKKDVTIYDYWWIEPDYNQVWNAVVIGDSTDGLVKFAPTRFKRIPIYVSPVGGLPDTGALSQNLELDTQSYNAGSQAKGDRWKEEIGQSVVATNENIYRTWNRWWTFTLQLMRDTAQPAVFERSRSGRPIVKPEDLFRRGSIFRGGPDDSVEFIGGVPIPLELRSTQLDLEAMMQRGGVSWAMHGSVSGQVSAYVMSQIAASANQIIKPFHQALIDLMSDIDNDLIDDARERGISPYGWKVPKGLNKEMRVTAEYSVEIPGEMVQKATVARMLDPQFSLSYDYVLHKLFADIKNPMLEKARIRKAMAEAHPTNALIALIAYYREQSAFLRKNNDDATAELYDAAEQAAMAELQAASAQRQLSERAAASRAIPPEAIA